MLEQSFTNFIVLAVAFSVALTEHSTLADEKVQVTIHETRNQKPNEMTGRYVTFELPSKHLGLGDVNADQPVRIIRMYMIGDQKTDGSFGFRPQREEGEISKGNYSVGDHFLTMMTTTRPSLAQFFMDSIIAARKSEGIFAGYERSTGYGDFYWMRQTHCGFDVFEWEHPGFHGKDVQNLSGYSRSEMRAPLNIGRMFGYPDNAGGYEFVVQCKIRESKEDAVCSTSLPFNDYINLVYIFDSTRLCRTRDLVHAHERYLESRIVDMNDSREGD